MTSFPPLVESEIWNACPTHRGQQVKEDIKQKFTENKMKPTTKVFQRLVYWFILYIYIYTKIREITIDNCKMISFFFHFLTKIFKFIKDNRNLYFASGKSRKCSRLITEWDILSRSIKGFTELTQTWSYIFMSAYIKAGTGKCVDIEKEIIHWN